MLLTSWFQTAGLTFPPRSLSQTKCSPSGNCWGSRPAEQHRQSPPLLPLIPRVRSSVKKREADCAEDDLCVSKSLTHSDLKGHVLQVSAQYFFLDHLSWVHSSAFQKGHRDSSHKTPQKEKALMCRVISHLSQESREQWALPAAHSTTHSYQCTLWKHRSVSATQVKTDKTPQVRAKTSSRLVQVQWPCQKLLDKN